jgi:dTDP-4-amino-4,6-dideoxygalactose transaminase
MGPEVAEFEAAMAGFCGSRHALGCANGTDALQLALMALGIKEGDAVIVPSFTFAATAEVVPFLGATPVFADVDPRTFNLDPASLQRCVERMRADGLRPAAVIAVDLFGLAADYDAIAGIARASDMKLVVDSAQGFGATVDGRMSVTLGDIATTSFFPAKPLGCYGDGGAVFTDDDDLADLIRSCRVHGKGREKYDNVRIGMNSRLDTIQAAILLEKIAIYQDEIEARQRVANRYTDALSDVLDVPRIPQSHGSVWAQYTVRAADPAQRQRVMDALKAKDIPSVVYYPMPLHRQTAYVGYPADPNGLPVSEDLAARVFSLPMHPYLDAEDQDRVIETIKTCLA